MTATPSAFGANDHCSARLASGRVSDSIFTFAWAFVSPVLVTSTRIQFKKFSPSVGQSNAFCQSLTVGKGVAHRVTSYRTGPSSAEIRMMGSQPS